MPKRSMQKGLQIDNHHFYTNLINFQNKKAFSPCGPIFPTGLFFEQVRFFSGLCFGSACKSSIHFSAIHTTERHNSKLQSTYKSACNSFRATYFASLLLISSRKTWKGKFWCCSKKKTIPEQQQQYAMKNQGHVLSFNY